MQSHDGSLKRSRRASLPSTFSAPNDRFTDLPNRNSWGSRPEESNAVRRQRSSSDPYRSSNTLESASTSHGRIRGMAVNLDAIPEDDNARERPELEDDTGRTTNLKRDSLKIRSRNLALESLSGLRVSGLGEKEPDSPLPTYGSPVVRQRNPFTDDYAYSPEPGRDFGSPRIRPIARNTLAPHATAPDLIYLPGYEYQEENSRFKKPTEASEGTFSRLRSFLANMTKEPELPSPPGTRAPSRASSPSRQNDDEGDEEKSRDLEMIEDTSKPRGRPQSEDMVSRAVDISRADAKYGQDPASRLHELDVNGQLYPMTANDRGKHVEISLPKLPDNLHHLPFDPHVHRDGDGGLRVGPDDSRAKVSYSQKLSYRERRKKPKHRIMYNRDTVEAQHRFILFLAKALLVFGSPSHRVEPQLESVAKVFEISAQFVHTPGCVQISFGLPEQHASETILVKAISGLDLGRIHATHAAYRAVCRDEIPASEGTRRLEELLKQKPIYSEKLIAVLTFIQGFLLCGSSFGGSLNDMWVSGILSVLVHFAQKYAARSDLSSSGADIFIATFAALVARMLSVLVPNRLFCFQSISSTSVAGLLPGSIMLAGVLDIASHNIYLGAPKLVTGLMTSLYLGFGLTLGSDVWLHFDSRGRKVTAESASRYFTVNGTFFSMNASIPALSPEKLTGMYAFMEGPMQSNDIDANGCYRAPDWRWYLRPLPWYTLFATLPILNLVLSMKRAQPIWTLQMPVMIGISCVSYAATHLCSVKLGLSGHPDYTALLGSFIVSLLGNIYSRRMGGTAFTIMLTGIWLLIPTGLAQTGGLSASNAPGQEQDEYAMTLDLARKMISVIIGVMSGVYLSARVVYTFGKKKNTAFITF